MLDLSESSLEDLLLVRFNGGNASGLVPGLDLLNNVVQIFEGVIDLCLGLAHVAILLSLDALLDSGDEGDGACCKQCNKSH